MARAAYLTHPARKLTEEEWEALRVEVSTNLKEKVKDICERKGVSTQRFYKKFPAGNLPGETNTPKGGGGEASDLPPSEPELADTP